MKHISIDIAVDGEILIDAVGFSGPDCEKATRFLEEALGTPQSRQRKPEYRRRMSTHRHQSVTQRSGRS